MPWWIWPLVAVFVLVLILNEVRQRSPWFAGKLGSFLSPLGALVKGWPWTNIIRLAAIPVIIGAVVLYAENHGATNERLEQAEDTRKVIEHETGVANQAVELSERTHHNTNAARAAAEAGQEDIANAVASLPPVVTAEHFAELDRRYRSSYQRVLGLDAGSTGQPDPGAAGLAPVRRSPTNPA